MSKSIILSTVPSKKSGSEEWVQWYRTLNSKVGSKNARIYWVKAWSIRGGIGSPANTRDLREAMSKHGIEISSDASSKVTDFFGDIGDYVGSAFNIGKYVAVAVTIGVSAAFLLMLFNLARKPVESIGAIAKARTGGTGGTK